jgi:tetratricopeptide (TPR) repeat protein
MKKTYKPASQRLLINFVFVSIIIIFCGGTAAAQPELYQKNCTSRTYRVMARAYMAYGEYGKALPLAEKALALMLQQKTSEEELASSMGDVAFIYLNLDKFEDAEIFCKLSIFLQKQIYYERHPYVAYSLRTLSTIYQAQGNFTEAEETIKQAIDIMSDSHPAGEAVFAPFQVDYAKLLAAQGKLNEAEQYYDKAMKLINQTFGSEHLYSATVLADVAQLYTLQGRYSEAEPLINKSQAIQEKYYGKENQLITGAYLTKAAICRAKGNSSEADQFIEMARNSVKKTGSTQAIAKLETRIDTVRQTNVGQVRQVKPDTSSPVVKLVNSAS